MSTKQRTFYVNGQKIVIKSRSRSSMGNPNGFHVFINGEKFYCNLLERNKAEDHCYVKWVKKQASFARQFVDGISEDDRCSIYSETMESYGLSSSGVNQ